MDTEMQASAKRRHNLQLRTIGEKGNFIVELRRRMKFW
jgi:hypothetical protein